MKHNILKELKDFRKYYIQLSFINVILKFHFPPKVLDNNSREKVIFNKKNVEENNKTG